MKTKGVAALLAFLGGGIGLHKFYLGQAGQGVLYLVFCWTFIPAFIAFLEMFVYLTMSDFEFDHRYNQLVHQPVAHALPAPQQTQMGQNVTINMANQNVADELEKLNRLRVAGALNDAEFETQKRKLLS